MDKNNGQKKNITERVYSNSDLNNISLGFEDNKKKIEKSIHQTPQGQRVQPHNVPRSVPNQRRVGPQQSNTAARNLQQRRPTNVRRGSKHSGENDSFLHFMIILIILILVATVVFLVVNKDDNNSSGEVPTEAESKETKPKTDEASHTLSNETTDGTTDSTTEDIPVNDPVPSFTFISDLSEYEMYMNPEGEARDAYLLLVNTKNPLASDYVPDDLVDVKSTRAGKNTQKLRLYAAKSLEALMIEAKTAGMVKSNPPSGYYTLSVVSGYRSYSYQSSLFNTYTSREMAVGITREEAEKIVETYSCRPGTSEHQSGLCIDILTTLTTDQAFAKEDEAKWLAENCYKFGFILRFPEDKTDITGIIYEPWHFRYVGRYHATKIHEMGMCLEEYTEYLKNVQE